MTQNYELAQWYITTLTRHPDTVMDWRAINDSDKGKAAHLYRGTLRDMWNKLVEYNNTGWGIFCCINQMDGNGHHLENVQFIRTHIVDLDNLLSSQEAYNRAVATNPPPHFAVQTSPGKFHLYWKVEPYVGNEFYNIQQRKLRQLYDGDKSVIDPTRVLRVPGFYHLKAQPHLVTCWNLSNYAPYPVAVLADSLQHITTFDNAGTRSPLGDPEMAAPSVEWLKFALYQLNPNELDRSEWMSISAAFKQSGWSLTNEMTLLRIWEEWCAFYAQNDPAENRKLWNSFRDTEVGWAAFERRTSVKAYMMQAGLEKAPEISVPAPSVQVKNAAPENAVQNYPYPEMLSPAECEMWFKDCYFVSRLGKILDTNGRFMDQTQFNVRYGGKQFIISGGGKTTDEAWKAATKSTQYKIPVVDHIRFKPTLPSFAILNDSMGRKGINIYIPIKQDARAGDVSRFLRHMEKIIPNEQDRNIWYAYMAHNVKFPGHKIRWAMLLQSTEGIGKNVIYDVMKHCLGSMYMYSPKATELASSGSKFNAWQRGKLCIVVNEIRVPDDKRDMVEILKPLITDAEVEVQGKGQDQEMEDNVANWIFFSNYKDAIPISKNGRRYYVIFSPLQTEEDIFRAGFNDEYFNSLFHWLEQEGGHQAVMHWLLNYPIEAGALPVRAPHSSSHNEALKISRSPMQVIIDDALEDQLQGFRGGYISSIALTKRVTAANMKAPAAHSIRSLLESMGYFELGRGLVPYQYEDIMTRAVIYARDRSLTLEGYPVAQGY